jgi:hypothetical protein
MANSVLETMASQALYIPVQSWLERAVEQRQMNLGPLWGTEVLEAALGGSLMVWLLLLLVAWMVIAAHRHPGF